MEKERKPLYKYCIVPRCKNTTTNTPEKLFFAIPRDNKIRTKWCKVMQRNAGIASNSSLYCCEDHFNIEEDTENFMEYNIMTLQEGEKTILRLKKGIVPHKFLCQKPITIPPPERKCAIKRQRQALVEEAVNDYALKQRVTVKNIVGETSQTSYCEAGPSSASSQDNLMEDIDSKKDSVTDSSTNISSVNITGKDRLQIDRAIQVNIKEQYRSKSVNVSVKTNNIALSPISVVSKNISTSPLKSAKTSYKIKLFPENPVDVVSVNSNSSVLSIDYEPNYTSESSWSIEDESEKEKEFKNLMRSGILAAIEREPKMLLGLPKRSFHLIQLLSENIPLPTIDILMTLKKIKLNESFSILGLQFGYAQSTISRIFSKSILTIAEKMKELIVWPSPTDIIFKNLPIAFRARYSNVVSIIDCLEIEIEKPSNSVHQSMTWSQYKKCNTLKYLISCTPDGLINFISDGYGGRATDLIIVKDCGFLECLPPNKAVMADRGFKDLAFLLGNKSCSLVRPPSVSKSIPSTKEDVKQSKRIAALRIHVERVISRLREFHMLLPHACVDHNLIPDIDEVIVVACGLINIQDVLIKK